jgi:hypothetical protein
VRHQLGEPSACGDDPLARIDKDVDEAIEGCAVELPEGLLQAVTSTVVVRAIQSASLAADPRSYCSKGEAVRSSSSLISAFWKSGVALEPQSVHQRRTAVGPLTLARAASRATVSSPATG